MSNEVTAAITEQNSFTDWLSPKKVLVAGVPGYALNLSIFGTWAGSVSIQRTFDDGTTILDVPTEDESTYVYTYNTEQRIVDIEEGVKYRLGIKTGNYTSGTCNVRLGA